MILLQYKREIIPNLMPKNGVVAEIGVAEGDFSECILQRNQPSRLHLIDPWAHVEEPDYQNDRNNTTDEEGERRFQNVIQRFQPAIDSETVKVHRGHGERIASEFPDNYFDWIYIDAMHSYEAVTHDLQTFLPKVKENGFICGHDYTQFKEAQNWNFGVVEAVNDFIKKNDCEFMALTFEPCPTYVLSKGNKESKSYNYFMQTAIYNLSVFIEIENLEQKQFRQRLIEFKDVDRNVKTTKYFMSIK